MNYFFDAFLYLGLRFLIAHEVAHLQLGHETHTPPLPDIQGMHPQRAHRLRTPVYEISADAYATEEVLKDVLERNREEFAALNPSLMKLEEYILPILVVVAITGVFLLHITGTATIDLMATKHPSTAYRQHIVIQVINEWLGAAGGEAGIITEQKLASA